jgi:hypothetical protein
VWRVGKYYIYFYSLSNHFYHSLLINQLKNSKSGFTDKHENACRMYPFENPIAGFPRKFRHSAPPGALAFEQFLLRVQTSPEKAKYFMPGSWVKKERMQSLMEEWDRKTGLKPPGATLESYITYFTFAGSLIIE